jgi:hypothetical protein
MKTDAGQPIGLLSVSIGFSQGRSQIFQHVAIGHGAGTQLFEERLVHPITVGLFKRGTMNVEERSYMQA